MANNVFRQKNIDKINSPESLNDYVRVTSPSVWIILVGTVLLLFGALVFSAYGKIDTNVNVAVCVLNGEITTYVDEADIDSIASNMKIKIGGSEYSIKSIGEKPIKASEVDEYIIHKANMEFSQWVFPVAVEGTLRDGAYIGTITIERISPISYIFN